MLIIIEILREVYVGKKNVDVRKIWDFVNLM